MPLALISLDSVMSTTYFLAVIPLLLALYGVWVDRKLSHIPTVGGPSAPILSFIGVYNVIRNGRAVVQEGYNKHKGRIFKIASMDQWIVVVTGSRLVDELQKFPDDCVSASEAVGELSSIKYTLGRSPLETTHDASMVQQHLTRRLALGFSDVGDEIVVAFDDLIRPNTNEWVSAPALSTMRQIVNRASNRTFVGLPLCRNKEFLDMTLEFTLAVGKGKAIVTFFPNFLKPWAGRVLTRLDERIDVCSELLRDTINERIGKMKELGNGWGDKPQDMVQWLIEDTMKLGRFSVRNVARIILLLNFGAVNASSNAFTSALFYVASDPDLAQALREEVKEVVQAQGWTKIAVGQMHKLDSFMRESQRLNGINGVSVMRKALRDLEFSNGTRIPAGTILVAPVTSTHLDEENYPNADVFDPWRFLQKDDANANEARYQYTTTAPDYVTFGHGRHACPGRFFAATELKLMMAHLVLNYDVKFETNGPATYPSNKWFSLSFTPDPTVRVMFRKRRS